MAHLSQSGQELWASTQPCLHCCVRHNHTCDSSSCCETLLPGVTMLSLCVCSSGLGRCAGGLMTCRWRTACIGCARKNSCCLAAPTCLAACPCRSMRRYYSAYNYYRWWLKGEAPPTPDDFHSHAVRVMQQWTDCVAAKSVAKCVRRFQPQQLIKGMYAEFLPVSVIGRRMMRVKAQQTSDGQHTQRVVGLRRHHLCPAIVLTHSNTAPAAAACLLDGRTHRTGSRTGPGSSCSFSGMRTTLQRSHSTCRLCCTSWASRSRMQALWLP